jgi:hypothetical protein
VMGLLVASLSSWYTGAVCFFFAAALLLAPPASRWGRRLGARAAVLGFGVLAVAPFAALVSWAAKHPDNLVRIKGGRELAGLRRSTGAADIVGYFAAGDFRSPDFRVLSRYGEAFIHCHYIGYVLLVGAMMALSRPGARRQAFLWLGGAVGFVLSLGPVLVRGGQPLILWTDRVIPLPYFLVEWAPGFSSLSLIYRLAMAPALACALLAAAGFAGRRYSPLVPALILLECALLSPLHGLPETTTAVLGAPFSVLHDAPEGAVMNFPVVGGRPYLYEQTVHEKPITDTINFPNNATSRRVWATMLESAARKPADFRATVGSVARREGVRYLVVHRDEEARPDMHDLAVRAVEGAFEPLAEDAAVQVYKLW